MKFGPTTDAHVKNVLKQMLITGSTNVSRHFHIVQCQIHLNDLFHNTQDVGVIFAEH